MFICEVTLVMAAIQGRKNAVESRMRLCPLRRKPINGINLRRV